MNCDICQQQIKVGENYLENPYSPGSVVHLYHQAPLVKRLLLLGLKAKCLGPIMVSAVTRPVLQPPSLVSPTAGAAAAASTASLPACPTSDAEVANLLSKLHPIYQVNVEQIRQALKLIISVADSQPVAAALLEIFTYVIANKRPSMELDAVSVFDAFCKMYQSLEECGAQREVYSIRFCDTVDPVTLANYILSEYQIYQREPEKQPWIEVGGPIGYGGWQKRLMPKNTFPTTQLLSIDNKATFIPIVHGVQQSTGSAIESIKNQGLRVTSQAKWIHLSTFGIVASQFAHYLDKPEGAVYGLLATSKIYCARAMHNEYMDINPNGLWQLLDTYDDSKFESFIHTPPAEILTGSDVDPSPCLTLFIVQSRYNFSIPREGGSPRGCYVFQPAAI